MIERSLLAGSGPQAITHRTTATSLYQPSQSAVHVQRHRTLGQFNEVERQSGIPHAPSSRGKSGQEDAFAIPNTSVEAFDDPLNVWGRISQGNLAEGKERPHGSSRTGTGIGMDPFSYPCIPLIVQETTWRLIWWWTPN